MADVKLGGNPLHTNGELPAKGSHAADFSLVNADLGTTSLDHFKGKKLILNMSNLGNQTCKTSILG